MAMIGLLEASREPFRGQLYVLFESLSSLFSTLFFLDVTMYVFIAIIYYIFSLLSSLFCLRSSFRSRQRRGGLRAAYWDPPRYLRYLACGVSDIVSKTLWRRAKRCSETLFNTATSTSTFKHVTGASSFFQAF